MSYFPKLQQYLLKYQVKDEDALFGILYGKHFEQKVFPQEQPLPLKEGYSEQEIEDNYLKYKQDTYLALISSMALTIPTGISVMLVRFMNRNVVSEALRLQRLVKVLIIFAIPSFALFNIGVYRRLFVQYEPEVLLKKKYAFYLDKQENKSVRKNY